MAFSSLLTSLFPLDTLRALPVPRNMDVQFKDKSLASVETDRAAAETRLPISVINSLRQKLILIRAAPDERTLRNWKSLHYEKMEGNERSVRLNDQFRLIFTLDTEITPNRVTILRVWNHD
jgi:toxin HigB-1